MGKGIPFIQPLVSAYVKLADSLDYSWAVAQTAKEKGTLVAGMLYFFLAYLPALLYYIVLYLVYDAPFLISEHFYGEGVFLSTNTNLFVLLFILLPVLEVLVSLAVNGVAYALARAFGGRSSFSNQFFHVSRISAACSFLALFLSPFIFSNSLSFYLSIGSILLSAYLSLLIGTVLSRLHSLGGMKAVIPGLFLSLYIFAKMSIYILGFFFMLFSANPR